MRIIGIFVVGICFFSPFAAKADSFGTADRTSYIITLDRNLSEQELDACMESICRLSGNRAVIECEVISKRARIAAANLSNAATRKVGALSCVASLRAERFDFEPRPRSGRSD
jgi:hypothetical protein